MSGRPIPGPRWALHLILVVAIAAGALLGPRCGGDPPPAATVEDGTEVDDTTWFLNGINFRNRIGVKDLQSHDLGLRFETPDLVQGQQVVYARIVLPVTGDGSVNGSLPLDIVGLDVDYVDFFSNLRPSENPATTALSPWLITQNWPGFTELETYSCVPLRRYSPDVSAIVNEILARPTWGTGLEKNLGLVIKDATSGAVVGDNFVTTQDTTGYGSCSNQHAARLEIFETVRDTFLGKELLGRITDQSVVVNAWSLLPVDVYFEWGTSPGVYTHSTAAVSYAPETTIEQMLSGLSADTQYFYRMGYRQTGATGFDFGPERSFRTQRPPESTYTFVVQADSHIQNRFTNANQDGLDLYVQTLANAAADAPDFMIDLGDTFHSEYIQGRNIEDLDESIHRHLDQRPYLDTINHSVPLFLVLGNHEGELGWERNGTADNLAVWATTARKLIYPNPVPDAFYTGSQTSEPFVGLRESYYAFEWGDALFVVLDPFWNTQLKPHDLGGPATGDRWDWTLGFTQYDWLRTTLEQSNARFKFVFSHHVAGGITAYGRGGIKAAKHAIGGDGSYEWGGEDPDGTYVFDTKRPGWGKPIHDLMADNNVAAFFTGHDHVFVQETLDDVLYVEVPQPSNASYNKGFPENSDNYAGTLVNNSGHLRVTVSGTRVDADYVRAYLPGDGTNGTVEVEITIFDCNRNGFVDAEEGVVCACQDGVDNDGDTLIDFPADPECSAAEDLTETLACADGVDNDFDALSDLADPGCIDALDDSEKDSTVECDDWQDNDGDGLIDLADPDCVDPTGPSESGALPACSDSLDNDGDGLADFPVDPGCDDALDGDERSAALVCDNGIDDDGDTLIDFPADPQCVSPTGPTETGECNDTTDNDGDGLIDLADPGCDDAVDGSELSLVACDNGVDDDLDTLIDTLDPGCTDPSDASEQNAAVACDDGADNDSDGLVDVADPGCAGPLDVSELNPAVECDDGVDNDGDSFIDLLDVGCADPTDPSELDPGGTQVVFEDTFTRPNSDVLGPAEIGGTWVEVSSGDNSVDADVNGNQMRFYTSGSSGEPRVTNTFASASAGTLDWSFEFTWDRDSFDSSYSLFLQIGNEALFGAPPGDGASVPGAAINLRWGDNGHGFADEEAFGYVQGATQTQVAVIQGTHQIAISADLDVETFDIEIDSVPVATGVAFDKSMATLGSLDAVRFYVAESISTFLVPDGRIDTIRVETAIPGPACGDAADNDGDGLVDLADPGCSGVGDASEQDPGLVCDDGADNDADALIDTADPGCSSPADGSEQDPALVCDDGADNDADGLVDLADPGCADGLDPSEQDPAVECDDGVDNDSDTLVDMADPDCTSPSDPLEAPAPAAACSDGTDNDGDGDTDYPNDAGCASASDPFEELNLAVVDDTADKIFGYLEDGTFLGTVDLDGQNGNAEGAAEAGGDLYVVDASQKRVFHYSGTTGALVATSAVLRNDGGNTLATVSGMAIDGDDVWVVGVSSGSDTVLRYSLADLFSGSANENAVEQQELDSNNGSPGGLAIDGTYLYVLDANDRSIYRYELADLEEWTESRQLEQASGWNLDDPRGAYLADGSMWVVDRSSDEIYRYPLSSLFSFGGDLAASDEFDLDPANDEPRGL